MEKWQERSKAGWCNKTTNREKGGHCGTKRQSSLWSSRHKGGNMQPKMEELTIKEKNIKQRERLHNSLKNNIKSNKGLKSRVTKDNFNTKQWKTT